MPPDLAPRAFGLSTCDLLATTGNYPYATPQRRFLDTSGEIISTGTGITVKIYRRARSPVLRGAGPARRHRRSLVRRTPALLRIRLTLVPSTGAGIRVNEPAKMGASGPGRGGWD